MKCILNPFSFFSHSLSAFRFSLSCNGYSPGSFPFCVQSHHFLHFPSFLLPSIPVTLTVSSLSFFFFPPSVSWNPKNSIELKGEYDESTFVIIIPFLSLFPASSLCLFPASSLSLSYFSCFSIFNHREMMILMQQPEQQLLVMTWRVLLFLLPSLLFMLLLSSRLLPFPLFPREGGEKEGGREKSLQVSHLISSHRERVKKSSLLFIFISAHGKKGERERMSRTLSCRLTLVLI